jgi:hypothetical protein
LDRDVVVILSGAGATVIPNVFVIEAKLASTTFTVKVEIPDAAGVPLIWEPDKFRPEGRAPVVMDHVYGTVPPLACKVCEYGTPTWPAGKLPVDIASAGATTILNAWVSESGFLPELVALTVKLKVPEEFGDPLSVPLGASESPEGKLPAETLQL